LPIAERRASLIFSLSGVGTESILRISLGQGNPLRR
jgi:hypothetical protein